MFNSVLRQFLILTLGFVAISSVVSVHANRRIIWGTSAT